MIRRNVDAIALLLVLTSSGDAQASAPDAVTVEKSPAPYPNNRAPAYPRALIADTTLKTLPAGRGVVELTVRVDGSVDPATIQVVAASDTAFIAPVLAVLPDWKFLAAESGPAPNGPCC